MENFQNLNKITPDGVLIDIPGLYLPSAKTTNATAKVAINPHK